MTAKKPTVTCEYTPHTRVLRVTYARPDEKGSTFEYHNVPTHVHAALERAESKGAFVVHHIKGKYKTVSVND